jgi:membrane protein required for colicin V production
VSLVRGFVKEAVSLVVWIAAIWLGFHYSSMLGEQHLSMVEPAGARAPLAFFAILIIVLIVGAIFNYVISRLVAGSGLSFIDRFFGMVFGFARGVLLIAVLILACQISAFAKPWLEHSQLAVYFEGVTQWLGHFVPQELDHVKETVTGMKGITVPTIGSDKTTTAPETTQPAAPMPATPEAMAPAQPQATTPAEQPAPQPSAEPAQQLPNQQLPPQPTEPAPAQQPAAPSMTPSPSAPEHNAPSTAAPQTPTTTVPSISPQTT